MKFSELEQHLSIPRLHRFYQICGSKTKAKRLYEWNLKLARDFHPLLGVLEVVLRNRVYDAVANHFTDSDWIITQSRPAGFMSDSSLAQQDYKLKSKVRRAQRELIKRGAHITASRVIAEQTFSFGRTYLNHTIFV